MGNGSKKKNLNGRKKTVKAGDIPVKELEKTGCVIRTNAYGVKAWHLR